jgi:hypothetical protein
MVRCVGWRPSPFHRSPPETITQGAPPLRFPRPPHSEHLALSILGRSLSCEVLAHRRVSPRSPTPACGWLRVPLTQCTPISHDEGVQVARLPRESVNRRVGNDEERCLLDKPLVGGSSRSKTDMRLETTPTAMHTDDSVCPCPLPPSIRPKDVRSPNGRFGDSRIASVAAGSTGRESGTAKRFGTRTNLRLDYAYALLGPWFLLSIAGSISGQAITC